MTPRARVFFAFRSPFSWMAIHRLQAVVPDAFGILEFIPYWEPDARTASALSARGVEFHYVPMSKAKHLYILQDTKRLASRYGLSMMWPVDINPWWEVSHLGWLKARQLGRAAQFYEAVVAARWERGTNIDDPRVIHEAAEAVGLDGDVIVGAAEDADIRAEGVACLARAYDDDIFGVPYFRVGPHRFWGLDRLDDFLDVLRARADVRRPAAAVDPLDGVPWELRALVGAYDTDTAGGCG